MPLKENAMTFNVLVGVLVTAVMLAAGCQCPLHGQPALPYAALCLEDLWTYEEAPDARDNRF